MKYFVYLSKKLCGIFMYSWPKHSINEMNRNVENKVNKTKTR